MLAIDGLDHLVLTVRDLRATIEFYVRVLGMREATFITRMPLEEAMAHLRACGVAIELGPGGAHGRDGAVAVVLRARS